MHDFSHNILCNKMSKMPIFVVFMPHYKNKYTLFLKIFFAI